MEKILTIKEAAKMVDLPAHTVRYYDQEGLLHPLKRDTNGNRMFSLQDIDWLKLICCLRDTGMSISDVKKFVGFYFKGDENMDERMKILCNHKESLLKKMEEMNGNLERIDNKIKWYQRNRKNI